MNAQQILSHITARAKELETIIQRRCWHLLQPLTVGAPAAEWEILRAEKTVGTALPDEMRELFRVARRVEFDYQFDEQMPADFRGIFSGSLYWNLDELPAQYEDYLGWVEGSLTEEYNDQSAVQVTKRIAQNKIPLTRVPNGDLIVVGYNPSEVIYLDHEGDSMHGKVLGKSLFEFLLFHARVGFVGSEGWQFEPFYDFERDIMPSDGPAIQSYETWLNKNR